MLTGQTALVTGSSRGIGRAIAEAFGQNGADVTVNYHQDADGARAARDAIRAEGQRAIAVQADVSDPDDADHLVAETHDRLGEVDILVNNAGVFPRHSWDAMSREEWDAVLDVNLGGLFNMTKQVAPAMEDRQDGVILNLSSTWAITGGTDNAAYTASKGGIVAVTRQLCREFAENGVRVNALCPGATATAMNEDLRTDQEYVDDVEDAVPVGRFGTPEEVAAVATFLASDGASYIHGQNIVVDGGLTA